MPPSNATSILNTNSIPFTPFSSSMCSAATTSSPLLKVPFGQITFNAEGQEARNTFFSRRIHYPGGANSGVTLGRGYDMGGRSGEQILSDLTSAGVPLHDAEFFASSAGLKGQSAATFVKNNRSTFPELTLEAQHNLFNAVLVPEYVSDIQRIFEKADVVEKYGAADWDTLPTNVQSLLFDLRYRGDYTGETRTVLQPSLVAGDVQGFFNTIRDESYWLNRGVPSGRVAARIAATYEE